MKTSVVFWGAGTGAPGWLVRCLSEFAFRGVNLTRIESRPLKRTLGEYVFFVDLDEPRPTRRSGAIAACARTPACVKRVLGSYPAAPVGAEGPTRAGAWSTLLAQWLRPYPQHRWGPCRRRPPPART
jgi:hypothetical protein